MDNKIKSHILALLAVQSSIKRSSIAEIIQNNYKGTCCSSSNTRHEMPPRAREINIAITELVSEYKVETDGIILKATEEHKNSVREECLLGIMYN